MILARENNIGTIAFPAISTGAYHFPYEQAAYIAINEVRKFIARNNEPQRVIFVLFKDELYNIYKKIMADE
jgi:O-acetyl-ADP-ribose deacetylase (regulator of RNase III)